MDDCERLSLFHKISDFLAKHKTNRQIDPALFGLSSATQNQRADTDLITLDMRDVSLSVRKDFLYNRSLRKQLCIKHGTVITALRPHKLPQFLQCAAVLYHFRKEPSGLLHIGSFSTGNQHVGTERHTQFHEIIRSVSF